MYRSERDDDKFIRDLASEGMRAMVMGHEEGVNQRSNAAARSRW